MPLMNILNSSILTNEAKILSQEIISNTHQRSAHATPLTLEAMALFGACLLVSTINLVTITFNLFSRLHIHVA